MAAVTDCSSLSISLYLCPFGSPPPSSSSYSKWKRSDQSFEAHTLSMHEARICIWRNWHNICPLDPVLETQHVTAFGYFISDTVGKGHTMLGTTDWTARCSGPFGGSKKRALQHASEWRIASSTNTLAHLYTPLCPALFTSLPPLTVS